MEYVLLAVCSLFVLYCLFETLGKVLISAFDGMSSDDAAYTLIFSVLFLCFTFAFVVGFSSDSVDRWIELQKGEPSRMEKEYRFEKVEKRLEKLEGKK